jgi:hypothetical protein
MIMPANYSVIAENELTYVDGGAFNFYVDPIDDGGKLMATNLVKYIGVGYLKPVLTSVIDPWFQAEGSDGIKGALKTNLKSLFQGQLDATGSKRTLDKVQYGIANTIGVASALWVLGTQSNVVSTDSKAGSLSLTKATT